MTASEELATRAAQIEKVVRREFSYSVTLCVIALIPATVCLLLIILKPNSPSFDVWFQRSGLVMMVFALFAQSKADHMRALTMPNTFSTLKFEAIRTSYRNKQKVVSVTSLLLIIVGTAILSLGLF